LPLVLATYTSTKSPNQPISPLTPILPSPPALSTLTSNISKKISMCIRKIPSWIIIKTKIIYLSSSISHNTLVAPTFDTKSIIYPINSTTLSNTSAYTPSNSPPQNSPNHLSLTK
jgi:hypothetical protein